MAYRTLLGFNLTERLHCPQAIPRHPEHPQRIDKIRQRLNECGLLTECNVIEDDFDVPDHCDLTQIHNGRYLERLQALEKLSQKEINECAAHFDSVQLCKDSWKAALDAAACCRTLVTKVVKNEVPNAFALVRPPGHHALKAEANGFCLLNNAALAAKYAIECDHDGAEKVLIVDFDVHHGQGTQRAFYEDNKVFYFSVHRYENKQYWPHLDESNYDYIGEGVGTGYNANVPLNETHAGAADYMYVLWNVLYPLALEFSPDIVIVSAGFDACCGDPVGGMDVPPDVFAHWIYHLMPTCNGKIFMALEGGYNHKVSALCVEKCVRVLLGEKPFPLGNIGAPKQSTIETCKNTIKALRQWRCFHQFNKKHSPSPSEIEKSVQKIHINVQHTPETGNVDQSQLLDIVAFKDVAQASGLSLKKTGVIYNPLVELHIDPEKERNENPNRTRKIWERLTNTVLSDELYSANCRRLESNRIATEKQLNLVHPLDEIQRIQQECEDEIGHNPDNETYKCKDTYNAATISVGSVLQCMDEMFAKKPPAEQIGNTYAVVRPPGHHASETEYGFCIFNNVAVAAKYALEEKNYAEKILILDWDVHHGNGIQDAFYEDSRVLYISIHRSGKGFFPSLSKKSCRDVGKKAGIGGTVNIPFGSPYKNREMLMSFYKIVMPIAYEFNPDLVLVASGFDAAQGDELGQCGVSPSTFAFMTWHLNALAGGKVCLALEGGYNLEVLADCSEAVVRSLSARWFNSFPSTEAISISLEKMNATHLTKIESVKKIQSQYWKCFEQYEQ
jgi:histone deacetylase 6